MDTIGVYEAKTHLTRLLDEVANGKSLLITKHGIPHARLIPAEEPIPPVADTIAALRNARRQVTTGRAGTIREMIEEGRR